MSRFISFSETDHSGLTCWDTGRRVICWNICRRGGNIHTHTHVSATFTWGRKGVGSMLMGADSWLRGCPTLPLQIYDWEDLCPVGVQAAQTYLADRQACRFSSSGFMFQLALYTAPRISPRFTLYLNFTFPHTAALSGSQPRAIYWKCNYLCSSVEKRFYKESHILSNFPSSLKMADNGVGFLVISYMEYYFYYIILKSLWFMGPGLKTWWL